jgi:hypothetical protein
MKMKNIYLMYLLFLIGCGGSSGGGSNMPFPDPEIVPSQSGSRLPIPDNRDVEHYKILFVGNSHVASNSLPNIIQKLFENNFTNKLVTSQLVPGGSFLAERINDGITYEKIKSNSWTHIVLQAQKVSSSQSRLFPTEGAQTWIELVKSELLATPVLFPEHPQKGKLFEGRYIHDIHLGIAEKTPACVAPIGLAWDLALKLYPGLKFHQDDGNHAALRGSFLTALVLYQTISGEIAQNLSYIDDIDIDSNTQMQLAQVASQIIAENPPCEF